MKTAYVSLLSGGDAYLPGVDALGRSLTDTGTRHTSRVSSGRLAAAARVLSTVTVVVAKEVDASGKHFGDSRGDVGSGQQGARASRTVKEDRDRAVDAYRHDGR